MICKVKDGIWAQRAYAIERRTTARASHRSAATSAISARTSGCSRPTEHKADNGRFYGTVLSAVDLVWFTEEDHATKSNYADWAGSIDELLPEPK